jgi:hypothetical protein
MTGKPPVEAGAKLTNERLLQQIYDHYRDTLLNRKYYASRLTRVRRRSRTIEIVLALAAPGAVGGWAIWHSPAGERVWSIVAAVVVVVMVVKPLMNWQAAVERLTGLYTEFTGLYFDMKLLVDEISVEEGVSSDAAKKFRESLLHYGKIAKSEDPVILEKLRFHCYEEVKREIPAEKLWMPSPDVTDSRQPSLSE